MLALTNPNENGEYGFTSFNTRHVLSADWVISLSQSIGLSFHHTNTQYEFKREFNFTYLYKDDDGIVHSVKDIVFFQSHYENLSVYSIGLHTNLYFDQNIAPLGKYFKPEILLITFKSTYDQSAANRSIDNSYHVKMLSYPVLTNKKPFHTVAIGATTGLHRIFFNRLLFDIGFQFGFVVGGKKLDEWNEIDGFTNNKINQDNYIAISAKSRLTTQYLFNINAGLGLLIF